MKTFYLIKIRKKNLLYKSFIKQEREDNCSHVCIIISFRPVAIVMHMNFPRLNLSLKYHIFAK